jgi:hypothetical protein
MVRTQGADFLGPSFPTPFLIRGYPWVAEPSKAVCRPSHLGPSSATGATVHRSAPLIRCGLVLWIFTVPVAGPLGSPWPSRAAICGPHCVVWQASPGQRWWWVRGSGRSAAKRAVNSGSWQQRTTTRSLCFLTVEMKHGDVGDLTREDRGHSCCWLCTRQSQLVSMAATMRMLLKLSGRNWRLAVQIEAQQRCWMTSVSHAKGGIMKFTIFYVH